MTEMNHGDQHNQEEALDALLKQALPPKAPDWFEVKALARLRRERDEVRDLNWRFLRRWVLGGVVALSLLSLSFVWLGGEPEVSTFAGSGESLKINASEQDNVLFSAFAALASYSQHADEWNQESF